MKFNVKMYNPCTGAEGRKRGIPNIGGEWIGESSEFYYRKFQNVQ